jgi:hypothetical protein
MGQPTVLVYDPDTGEWVTPEEYQRRLERRSQIQDIASLLQGAVISFTLTGTVCGTTVTLTGTGVIAAVGTGRPGPGPSAPGPGRGGPGGRRGP